MNRRLSRFLTVLSIISSFASACATANELSDVQCQISAANERYAVAAPRRDAATIAADYEPDGMFVTAKGLRLVGRDAIRRFYAERLTRVTIVSVRCATKKLQSAATMAWEYGSCASTLRMSSGLRSFTSSYLTVWHKDADGKWRIAANMA